MPVGGTLACQSAKLEHVTYTGTELQQISSSQHEQAVVYLKAKEGVGHPD